MCGVDHYATDAILLPKCYVVNEHGTTRGNSSIDLENGWWREDKHPAEDTVNDGGVFWDEVRGLPERDTVGAYLQQLQYNLTRKNRVDVS